MSCWVTPTGAQEKDARAAAQAEQVTITGARLPSDEELTKQVATALRSDPYVDDSHLTVSVSNGVVRVEGIVVDHSDLLGALRITGRVSGVNRVIDDIQLHRMGDD